MNIYDVHFGDTAAAARGDEPFGAGHRRILLVSTGNKYVHVISLEDAQAEKLKIVDWEALIKKEELPIANQELAVKLKELAITYKRKGAIYREVMEALGYPDTEDMPEKEDTEVCTYPDCKCIVRTSDENPEPVCPFGWKKPGEKKVKEKKAAPVKTPKVVVAGTGEVPGQNEGSGLFMRRLWMTGNYTPDRLVELVLVSYPGRTTKKSDVYWNYNKLKELPAEKLMELYGRSDLPPWPKKEAKPAKDKPALKATVVKGKPDPEPPKETKAPPAPKSKKAKKKSAKKKAKQPPAEEPKE